MACLSLHWLTLALDICCKVYQSYQCPPVVATSHVKHPAAQASPKLPVESAKLSTATNSFIWTVCHTDWHSHRDCSYDAGCTRTVWSVHYGKKCASPRLTAEGSMMFDINMGFFWSGMCNVNTQESTTNQHNEKEPECKPQLLHLQAGCACLMYYLVMLNQRLLLQLPNIQIYGGSTHTKLEDKVVNSQFHQFIVVMSANMLTFWPRVTFIRAWRKWRSCNLYTQELACDWLKKLHDNFPFFHLIISQYDNN